MYWDGVLEEGETYTMSNAQVKMSNLRYNVMPNEFCIWFDQSAIILKADQFDTDVGSTDAAPDTSEYMTLKEIRTLPCFGIPVINFIAIIIQVEPRAHVHIKRLNESKDKLTMVLADETNV